MRHTIFTVSVILCATLSACADSARFEEELDFERELELELGGEDQSSLPSVADADSHNHGDEFIMSDSLQRALAAQQPTKTVDPEAGSQVDWDVDADVIASFAALQDSAGNARSIASQRATVYDLPLLANDLNDNEWYYTFDHANTFSQKFGYDISVRAKRDDGSWTSVKDGVTDYATDPHNTDSLAWGKNIYAMADGVVVGCWRNAPSNPRPKLASENSDDIEFEDRQWLHSEYRNGRISGGGNHLTVLQDDGTYALYAHAMPGSIPPELCPHNNLYYPQPVASNDPRNEHCVRDVEAVTNGARIIKGQRIGRIGNGGNSTGPHLHVHVATRDEARTCTSDYAFEGKQLTFRRGLSTPWINNSANIDAWTSFSGSSIPNGSLLFWPPTRLEGEVARHGFDPANYSRLFAHLSNSGFEPVIFDGYTVGNDTRYNFVWRPALRPWRALRNMTSAGLNTVVADQINDGYEPVWAESYTTQYGVRYAAIFEKGAPGSFLMKHGLTTAEHTNWLNTATNMGLKPTTISVIDDGGTLRYTDLFRSNSIGSWSLRSQTKASDYQDLFDANKNAGRWPIYANAYMHDGQAYFSVLFSSTGGPAAAGHGLTSGGYQNMWSSNIDAGRQTSVVSGYDGAQAWHRFIGVWK